MNWNITITTLCEELWTSLLRMGSPRVTPLAIDRPPRPTRRPDARMADATPCACLAHVPCCA